MPYEMKDLRLTTASITYYLISGLAADGWYIKFPNLKFKDDFPDDPAKINIFPTIVVSHDVTSLEPFQLGPGTLNRRRFNIIVYTQSDGVRDDLGQDIGDHLFTGNAKLKDYNMGFPPPLGSDPEPDIIGMIDFDNIRLVPSRFVNPQKTAVRHIMTISCDALIYSDE